MSPRSGTFVQTVDLPGAEEGPADILTSTLAQETNNFSHLIDARILMEVYLAGEAAANRRSEDLFPLREALAESLPYKAKRKPGDISEKTLCLSVSNNTSLS